MSAYIVTMVLFEHCLATMMWWCSWDHVTHTPSHPHTLTPSTPSQAFGVFGLCQIYAFVDYIRSKLTKQQFDLLFRTLSIVVGATAVAVFGTLTLLGSIPQSMGMSL